MFGEIMRTYRMKKGWSQEELAEKLHLSRSTISKIERNLQVFEVAVLAKLIKVTGDQTTAFQMICGADAIINFFGGG